MERAERDRLTDFLHKYDRGFGGEGVKIPDFVLGAAREALEARASDMPSCLQCGKEATWASMWDVEEDYFCSEHPTDEVRDHGMIWKRRYEDLLGRCEAATVPETIQEMRSSLVIALGKDLL